MQHDPDSTTTSTTTTATITGERAARRRAALGVTAGLLVGGAIGLFAVAPTFTSAATPDDSSTASTAAEPADGEDAEHPVVAGRLRELLQPLVDDGTIDADQADAVAAHLAEQRPGRRGHRPGFDGEVVANLIGIDAETLRDELRAGSSIADIAAENGVDPQVVIDALVDEASDHLDVAIESGRLTEDEATEKLADLTERITARVNGERPARR